MKRLVYLLISLLLFFSYADAQTVDDYTFAQEKIRELEDKHDVRILVGPEATVLYTDYDITVEEASFELTQLQKMLGCELDPEAETVKMLDKLDETGAENTHVLTFAASVGMIGLSTDEAKCI